MKIKDLAIDRYGAWSKLRLSDLDDRLNVVYGANGSGKTTVVRFLQAMLYGFPHFQESAAPAQSSPWGGSVAVEGPQGRCTIRRHDNGTRTGRLSLHTTDGAAIDRDVLPELLSGVDESVFRLLFIASFRDTPPTETVVQTALAHGFDLVETPREPLPPRGDDTERLRRLEEERREVERLKDRRRAVEGEIGELERGRVHLRYRREDELRRVQDELARCETDAVRLRRELKALDEEIAVWEERRAAHSTVALAGPDEDEDTEGLTLQRRLQAILTQLERWRRVQQDVTHRRTRLRREVMGWTAEGPDSPVVVWSEAQKHIDSIEQRLEQLQGEIRLLADPPAGENCNCREADRRCSPLVRAVRDEVYQLCRELNRHYLGERRDEITSELHQLRRCHAEVTSHIQRLARRKDRIERELEIQNAAIAPIRLRRQETADRLRRCEVELAELHEEQRRLERLPTLAEVEAPLVARRRELAALQRELDERLERLSAYERSELLLRARPAEPPAPQPTVIQEASEYLRRMTDGQFHFIHVWRNDRIVWLEDARGESFALDTQGRSIRDRVHLSLCLALVAGYARRGVHLPLILDDTFVNLDAAQAEQAALLLREFSARGHQVFVFTCREQVARLFRRLDVPVLELPVESSLHEQQAIRWASESAAPVSLPLVAASVAAPDPLAYLDDDLTPPLRDDEDEWRRASGPRQPRHYLQRGDGVHYAPDIDKTVAAELASQGIATVADFLALAPLALEQRLSHLGVSAETIRTWQAVARLMCDTPHLRTYDARILVASGVTSSEELARLGPEELLQRVERCLATDEGRRLFHLGDDEELARLASWVGSGRATQSLRETQQRHWSRRQHSDRSRRWYDESHSAERLPQLNGASRKVELSTGRRFYLELSSPVIDAPSIGPRTAERLHAIGVKTVADLLTISPESAARRIGHGRITAQTIRDWQLQAELVCSTPQLRGRDAQILVACGVTTVARLAASDAVRLYELVKPFVASVEGQRILRDGRRPDLAEVARWIDSAQHARKLHAA